MRAAIGGIVLLAAVGTTLASPLPDGLERVAADLGFADRSVTWVGAPLPDYSVGGLSPAFSGAIAGLLGALVVGAVAFGSGRALSRAQ